MNPENMISRKVRLTEYPKDHMNAYARIAEVREGEIVVSNLNMPFQGTLSWHVVPNGQWEFA